MQIDHQDPFSDRLWQEPLPQPFGGVARRCHASLLAHLQRRDECGVIRELVDSAELMSPAERPLACWIPCLIGLERSRMRGRPYASAPSIAHYIATNARHLLEHLPIRAASTWLVGATLPDQCASYLVAILQARRGLSIRPWWAPDLPQRGRYRQVSTLEAPVAGMDDPHCVGSLSLVEEVRIAAFPSPADGSGALVAETDRSERVAAVCS